MNEETIKPCPFCGSNFQEIVSVITQHQSLKYVVVCCNCEGCSPSSLKKEIAIEKWNQRA